MQFTLWLMLLLSLAHCQGHDGNSPKIADVPVQLPPITGQLDSVTNGNTIPLPIVNTMAHVDYLRLNIGVPPKDTVEVWLRSVGLGAGNPFCSAAVSYSLDVGGVTSPVVRSGLARNFVYKTPKALHIKADDVYKQVATVPAGSIVVYQRGETKYGHNGFVTADMTGNEGVYISANTSAPGSGGSESAGGGVWEKPFKINPYGYFRVTDFVLVSYE